MAEQDPSRRAVITGLGAVMPVGNDFPTYWANLQAGVTGTRRISSFDASAQEVQIAAEVLDFDPASAMDPKMARRMSRFIHFAMAAGKEAVALLPLDWIRETGSLRAIVTDMAARARSELGATSLRLETDATITPRAATVLKTAGWAAR